MEYKIIASQLANNTYLQNIEFVEKRWTKKEAIHFINKVSEVIDILKVTPYVFQKWEKDKNIHKITIVKQITLYYQVNHKNVELLIFWNNLQDPNKIKELV